MRRVRSEGGFATVIHKGYGDRAPVVLLLLDRGEVTAWERMPDIAQGHRWHQAASGSEAVEALVTRQRRFDPDLWVVELDIADAARFIDNSPAKG